MKISPPIKRPSTSLDFDKSNGNSNGTVDLFNLLSFDDNKQNISTTPSSWTTFDCKITLLVISHLLNICSIFFDSHGSCYVYLEIIKSAIMFSGEGVRIVYRFVELAFWIDVTRLWLNTCIVARTSSCVGLVCTSHCNLVMLMCFYIFISMFY
jgi:hypothetical protein